MPIDGPGPLETYVAPPPPPPPPPVPAPAAAPGMAVPAGGAIGRDGTRLSDAAIANLARPDEALMAYPLPATPNRNQVIADRNTRLAETGQADTHGEQINNAITDSYTKAAKELHTLFPGLDHTPVWMDYGKYASPEAGQAYVTVQALQQVVKDPTNVKDPKKLVADLKTVLSHSPQIAGQVDRLVQGLLENSGPVGKAMAGLIHGLEKAGSAGHHLGDDIANAGKKIGGPFGGLLKLAGKGVGEVAGLVPEAAAKGLEGIDAAVLAKELGKELDTMSDSLMQGNIAIQKDFGPPMEAFYKAESAGGDGVAAARAAMGPEGDRDGLFFQGLEKYHEASLLAKEAQTLPDDRRQALQAQAATLVSQGNRLLAAHEQNLVQPIFDRPQVHAIMGEITPALRLHDPNSPDGRPLIQQGNWADYKSRMGLADATAADITPQNLEAGNVIQVNGRYLKFVDPPPKGSIAAYFADTEADPAKSDKLIQSSPGHLQIHNLGPAVAMPKT